MRFNTVEIGHAYSDYLDSLEDWPPPNEAPPMAAAMESPATELDDVDNTRVTLRTAHH